MLRWEIPHTNAPNFFLPGSKGLRHCFASLIVTHLCLSGCHQKHETASEPPRISSSPAADAAAAPQVRIVERHHTNVIAGSPLRWSAETLTNLLDEERIQAILDAVENDGPVVTSSSTDSGHLVIKAIGVRADSSCRKLLESAGFKADGEVWSKRLNMAERRNLEGKLAQQLGENNKLETELRAYLKKARTPGALLAADPHNADQQWMPGKLVYTGQALDIACADVGADPHTFIEVESDGNAAAAYVRGGRLYIDGDGRLKIGKFKLPGDWRQLPENVEQITVQPDGKVQAVQADGTRVVIGELRLRHIGKVVAAGDVFAPSPGFNPGAVNGKHLRPGHLEYPALDLASAFKKLGQLLATRRLIDGLASALSHPVIQPQASQGAPTPVIDEPIVIHAELALTEQHLKALNIPVERTPGRTTITANGDHTVVSGALAKVLQVLRLRMSVHEQNFRNAEKIRDADNRINPYRRKLIKIGPQGEAVEESDPAPFPKTYKPGDPNADGEGFVIMPNVNRAVETAEFQAAAAEYKLVRAALERLSPYQIFPDPIALPVKTEGQ